MYEQDKDILKPWVDPHHLKNIHGTWYKGSRRVVTGGTNYKQTIIKAHHDSPVYGPPGITRTLQLTTRHYWWPGISRDIIEYVKGCAECQ